MRGTNRGFAFVLVFLLQAPDIALSQNLPRQQWTVLERLAARDKLAVELKDGKKVKGSFSSVTDTALTVFDKSKTRDVSRQDIRRIYRVRDKSIGKAVLRGTVIGGAVGASLGAINGPGRAGCGFGGGPCSRAATAIQGAEIMGILGALTGLIVGSIRQNRELIYDMGP